MARGLQKEQARAKAQLAAKQVGGKSTLKSNVKALSILCPKCFCSMLDYKSFSVHFLAKHPKDIIPTKESFGAAAEKSGQL